MRYILLSVLIIMSSGCGDIIKAKNPFKKSKPYQPEFLHDHTGRCPYYPAVWSGQCEGEGYDKHRTYPLNLTQSFCTFFLVENTAFRLDKVETHESTGLQHKTSGQWLNADRTELSLVDEWQQGDQSFVRTFEINHETGIATEQVKKANDPTQVLASCDYRRSVIRNNIIH